MSSKLIIGFIVAVVVGILSLRIANFHSSEGSSVLNGESASQKDAFPEIPSLPRTFFKQTAPLMRDINQTLSSMAFRPIASCPKQKLAPKSIHMIMIASPHYFKGDSLMEFNRKNVEYYAKFHGYHFRIVDPQEVMDKFGNARTSSVKPEGSRILAKNRVMLCTLYIS